MTIFERESSAVFAFGSMAAFPTSASQLANQVSNNLWPGRFAKDKTNKEYSTIMLMLVKDDRGKKNYCVTLGMILDDTLSRIRRTTVFSLCLCFLPSLQSAFCTQFAFCTDRLG